MKKTILIIPLVVLLAAGCNSSYTSNTSPPHNSVPPVSKTDGNISQTQQAHQPVINGFGFFAYPSVAGSHNLWLFEGDITVDKNVAVSVAAYTKDPQNKVVQVGVLKKDAKNISTTAGAESFSLLFDPYKLNPGKYTVYITAQNFDGQAVASQMNSIEITHSVATIDSSWHTYTDDYMSIQVPKVFETKVVNSADPSGPIHSVSFMLKPGDDLLDPVFVIDTYTIDQWNNLNEASSLSFVTESSKYVYVYSGFYQDTVPDQTFKPYGFTFNSLFFAIRQSVSSLRSLR